MMMFLLLNILFLYQYPTKTIKEIIQKDNFQFASFEEEIEDFAEFEL